MIKYEDKRAFVLNYESMIEKDGYLNMSPGKNFHKCLLPVIQMTA